MLLLVLTNLDKGTAWAGRPLLEPSKRRIEALSAFWPLGLIFSVIAYLASYLVTSTLKLSFASIIAIPVGLAVGLIAIEVLYISCARFAINRFRLLTPEPHFASRLESLLDSLGVTVGIDQVSFAVVDSDFPNVGSLYNGKMPTIIFTSGAVGFFNRVELEAVVARELMRIKSGVCQLEARLAYVNGMVGLFSGGSPKKLSAGSVARVALADISGVSVTRYPPALASALSRLNDIESLGQSSSKPFKVTAASWFVPGLPGISLDERIAELKQL